MRCSFLLDQPHSAAVIAAEASRFHVVAEPEIYVVQVLARHLNAVNHLLAEARHRIDAPDGPPASLRETLDRMGQALQVHSPTERTVAR